VKAARLPAWVRILSWVGMALLFAPLLAVAVQSFNLSRVGETWGGFTFSWYHKLVADKAILEATWNTLLVATLSTALSTVLGTLLAIGFHRTPWPRRIRDGFELSLLLPVVTPDILFAVALVGAYGFLRQISSLFEPGYVTLVVGHVTFQISFVTLVVRSRLAAIGPEQMEAARDLYEGTWGAWRRVMLPQIGSAIAAGAMLAFTLSLDDFVISFFASGPGSATLPLYIYASVRRGVTPVVHALSTVILCATLLAVLGVAWHGSLTGDSRRSARWLRRFLTAFGIAGAVVLGGVAWAGWQARHAPAAEPGKKPVVVLMYSEYIDPAMVEEFSSTTGMPLRIEVYEAQEEMIAKLQAGGDALYDVVVASDVTVRQLAGLGLLAPLDHGKIPNLANIDSLFASPPFDPGNRWSAPYLWGTTGILYSDTTVSTDSVTWFDVLGETPRFAPFVLMDESRTMLALALQARKASPNSADPAKLREAARLLQAAKGRKGSLGFDASVGGRNKVLGGSARAAVVFNGEAIAAISSDSGKMLRYAIPREGSVVWLDNMLVTARAPNPEGAHAFVNFILDAKKGAQLANFVRYPTPNRASLPFIAPEDLANPVIYPDSAIRARMEFLTDPGSGTRLFDEAWTSVKSD
jgi:ABC-type spermidine/putrescine transport system permease subunit II/spermidine/putrescine-binding protein